MFPIKTDSFSFQTNLTPAEIEPVISKRINRKKNIQLTYDNELYGYVKANHSKLELGQFPSKNGFRPIIVLNWSTKDNITEVNGYFRIDKRIIMALLILPISGILFSVQQQTLIPLFATTLFFLFVIFIILQPIYRINKVTTKTKLKELLSELNSTTSI